MPHAGAPTRVAPPLLGSLREEAKLLQQRHGRPRHPDLQRLLDPPAFDLPADVVATPSRHSCTIVGGNSSASTARARSLGAGAASQAMEGVAEGGEPGAVAVPIHMMASLAIGELPVALPALVVESLARHGSLPEPGGLLAAELTAALGPQHGHGAAYADAGGDQAAAALNKQHLGPPRRGASMKLVDAFAAGHGHGRLPLRQASLRNPPAKQHAGLHGARGAAHGGGSPLHPGGGSHVARADWQALASAVGGVDSSGVDDDAMLIDVGSSDRAEGVLMSTPDQPKHAAAGAWDELPGLHPHPPTATADEHGGHGSRAAHAGALADAGGTALPSSPRPSGAKVGRRLPALPAPDSDEGFDADDESERRSHRAVAARGDAGSLGAPMAVVAQQPGMPLLPWALEEDGELLELLKLKSSLRRAVQVAQAQGQGNGQGHAGQAQGCGHAPQLELILSLLAHMPVSERLLRQSQIAALVLPLRRHDSAAVSEMARCLLKAWKAVLRGATPTAAAAAPAPAPGQEAIDVDMRDQSKQAPQLLQPPHQLHNWPTGQPLPPQGHPQRAPPPQRSPSTSTSSEHGAASMRGGSRASRSLDAPSPSRTLTRSSSSDSDSAGADSTSTVSCAAAPPLPASTSGSHSVEERPHGGASHAHAHAYVGGAAPGGQAHGGGMAGAIRKPISAARLLPSAAAAVAAGMAGGAGPQLAGRKRKADKAPHGNGRGPAGAQGSGRLQGSATHSPSKLKVRLPDRRMALKAVQQQHRQQRLAGAPGAGPPSKRQCHPLDLGNPTDVGSDAVMQGVGEQEDAGAAADCGGTAALMAPGRAASGSGGLASTGSFLQEPACVDAEVDGDQAMLVSMPVNGQLAAQWPGMVLGNGVSGSSGNSGGLIRTLPAAWQRT